MKKLCCIFNTPSLYRELIYSLLEQSFDCEWYFEDTDNKVQLFDTSRFKKVTYLQTQKLLFFYRVKGLVKLINKDIKQFLIIGATRNLSVFFFLIIKSIFYPSKKAFLWTHGWYGKENRFERRWKKLMFRMADGIFLYGNYAKNIAIKNGIEPNKLFVIHNSLNYYDQLEFRKNVKPQGIFINHFGNNYPMLIMIGRVNARKKMDLLFYALADLKKNGRLFNLVIVGEGEDRKKLEALSNGLNISEQVWFYGACYDDKENAQLLCEADLCVVPGDVGLTAIHSLMFGCPVITHNYYPSQGPEFESILQEKTGAFFNHDDILSLSNAISQWFDKYDNKREQIKLYCYNEIDTQWNPNYQMNIFKEVLKW